MDLVKLGERGVHDVGGMYFIRVFSSKGADTIQNRLIKAYNKIDSTMLAKRDAILIYRPYWAVVGAYHGRAEIPLYDEVTLGDGVVVVSMTKRMSNHAVVSIRMTPIRGMASEVMADEGYIKEDGQWAGANAGCAGYGPGWGGGATV